MSAAGSVGRQVVTAVAAGVLLAAVGYVVLLSPWHATATVAGTECPHELAWRSDLYVAQERTGAVGAPLAEPAYDPGCASRNSLPADRTPTVYRLARIAPHTAFVDSTGRVWARVGPTADERNALEALPGGFD